MSIQQLKIPSLLIKQIVHQEEGQDLVEYVLLFMLIVVTAIVGITAFGGRVMALWNSVIGTF